MTGTEDTLRSALTDRADDLAPRGRTPLQDVARSARRVRRRQRLAAGAAGLAVVVAVTPFVLGGNRGGDAAPDPADPPRPPISVGFTANGVHHAPDGTTVDLPDTQVLGVAPSDDGLLVTSPTTEGLVVDTVASDGSVIDSACTSSPPVVSPDGQVTASISYACGDPSFSGRGTVEVAGAPRENPLELEGTQVLLGVSDDGTVTAVDAFGTVVSVSADDESRVLATDVTPLLFDATHQRLVVLEGGDEEPETRVLDVSGAEPTVLWRAAGEFPVGLSPHGERLVTGLGDDARVRDMGTGELLARLDGGPGEPLDRLTSLTWDGDDSLLSVRVEGNTGTVVRVGLDGTVTAVPGLPRIVADPDDPAEDIEALSGNAFDTESGTFGAGLAQVLEGPSAVHRGRASRVEAPPGG